MPRLGSFPFVSDRRQHVRDSAKPIEYHFTAILPPRHHA
jgi:hypothetical protein